MLAGKTYFSAQDVLEAGLYWTKVMMKTMKRMRGVTTSHMETQ